MQTVDVLDNYKKGIETFAKRDVSYFEDFLRFSFDSNLIYESIMNNVLLYSKKHSSDRFGTFRFWQERGRIPKKGTGICVLNGGNGVYVFGEKDTFIAKPELDKNAEPLSFVPSFQTKDVETVRSFEDVIHLSHTLSDNELTDFVSDCLLCMIDEKHHVNEELYAKYQHDGDTLFGWILPTTFRSCRMLSDIEIAKDKEKENDTENEFRSKYGSLESSNELRIGITGNGEPSTIHTEKDVDVSGEKQTGADSNLDGKGDFTRESHKDEPVLSRDTTGNGEEVAPELSSFIGPSVESRGISLGDPSSSELKTSNSVKEAKEHSTLKEAYSLGSIKSTSPNRFLHQTADFKEDNIELGRFVNYGECSRACTFWDRLSNEEKRKYYFMDGLEHTKEEYEEKRAVFEQDFKEYRDALDFLMCDYDYYREMLTYAKEHAKKLSDFEVAELFFVENIGAHHNYNEFIHDVFTSPVSLEVKKAFVRDLLKPILDQHEKWGIGRFVANKEDGFDIFFNPYAFSSYAETKDAVGVNISLTHATLLIESLVMDDCFKVIDYSEDFEHGGNIISEEFYEKYRAFQEKHPDIVDVKVCERNYRFRNKSLDAVKDVEKQKIFSEQILDLYLKEQTWDNKFSCVSYYEEPGHLPEERVAYLKKHFRYPEKLGCINQETLKNLDANRDYYVLGFTVTDDKGLGLRIYEGKSYYQVNMSWEELDFHVDSLIRSNHFLNEHDWEEHAAYFEECFQGIKKAHTEIGLPEKYLEIAQKAYKEKRYLTDEEACELTLMKILCDYDHFRYRIFLKEILDQKGLNKEEKSEILKQFVDKCFYRYFRTFDGSIWGADEEGIKLSVSDSLYSCNQSCDKIRLTNCRDRMVVPWDTAINIFETVVCNKSYQILEEKLKPGCSSVVPSGTIDLYNHLKETYHFESLYDTACLTDDCVIPSMGETIKEKPYEENEQIEMFSYMRAKGKSR